jgi:phenylalanyl-tRNA synthetase beta chain
MIRDFVETDLSAEEIGDLLTMTGFELEEITEEEGEPVLDVNIMANRGDGASVFGMARELLAKHPAAKPTELYKKSLNRHPASDVSAPDAASKTSVTLETPNCTRYACRIFEDVENGESPEWLQKRLRQIGQRPISLLVDLTNYVMMEQGQPLHAFDMDKLSEGRIVVKQAKDGDPFTTLDDAEHKLTADNMMICDGSGPVAVAGVMGGLETEVSATTKNCLLESAHFVNTSVRKTRKQLNLFTEASYRFERHVDPEGVVAALNRFAELYAECTGKSHVPGVVDVYPIKPTSARVTVRMDRANRILGMDVPLQDATAYLTRLGYEVTSEGSTITAQIPSWRIDVVQEEDLIEEIGRVHGFDKIPSRLPEGQTDIGGMVNQEKFTNHLHEEALRCGLDQMLSHSMRGKHPLDTDKPAIELRTPHSPEIAFLRTSLLPCLADAAVKNGGKNLHLYEYGHVFDAEKESINIALLVTGVNQSEHWGHKASSTADFYTAKGLVERLAESGNVSISVSPDSADTRLHPTRQASVLTSAGPAGVIGEIHPDIADQLGFTEPVIVAELDLEQLYSVSADHREPRSISRNPSIRRDIAFVIDKSTPYSDVQAVIEKAGGPVLEKNWLFDTYDGRGIEPGQHSLAVALQLRKVGENFTDEEANQVRDSIVSELEAIGAKLR